MKGCQCLFPEERNDQKMSGIEFLKNSLKKCILTALHRQRPSPGAEKQLWGNSEGLSYKALITAGSGGIFSVTGSIIGFFSVIVSRMRLSRIIKGVVLIG
jgi:hypothetical protein